MEGLPLQQNQEPRLANSHSSEISVGRNSPAACIRKFKSGSDTDTPAHHIPAAAHANQDGGQEHRMAITFEQALCAASRDPRRHCHRAVGGPASDPDPLASRGSGADLPPPEAAAAAAGADRPSRWDIIFLAGGAEFLQSQQQQQQRPRPFALSGLPDSESPAASSPSPTLGASGPPLALSIAVESAAAAAAAAAAYATAGGGRPRPPSPQPIPARVAEPGDVDPFRGDWPHW